MLQNIAATINYILSSGGTVCIQSKCIHECILRQRTLKYSQHIAVLLLMNNLFVWPCLSYSDQKMSIISFKVPVLPPKPIITPSGAEAKTKKQLGM